METLSLLLHGFDTALTFDNLIFCFFGVSFGMFVGVLPGLGPVAGTAMLIPITYGMAPVSAIIMLAGIFYGAMYGGTITSVLINVPGEAASVVTCFDGYELAKQGRAGTALGIAAIGSFFGGVVAILGLAFIGPPLAEFALSFGPPEYFSLMILGLSLLIGLMGKSVVRGLIAAFLGILLSFIGQDPISGEMRFTFGQLELLDGVDFVILAMGLFGLSEILMNAESVHKMGPPATVKGLFPKRAEWKPVLQAILRGTGVGMLIGLIPGTSASISSLTSYSLEKSIAKDPSRFGKGAVEGVAGPETANNAHSGAALIPLFTLGLPSSPTVAVLLGAFMVHGLQPGPALFKDNPDFVWGVIASMFIGNAILLVYNLPLARVWAKVVLIPYSLMFPFILLITIIGTYSVKSSLWDVGMMVLFGLLGYLMKKLDISAAITVLAFVIGSQIEVSFLQSLATSQNGAMIFFQRPTSVTLLALGVCGMIFSIMKKRKGIHVESDSEL